MSCGVLASSRAERLCLMTSEISAAIKLAFGATIVAPIMRLVLSESNLTKPDGVS